MPVPKNKKSHAISSSFFTRNSASFFFCPPTYHPYTISHPIDSIRIRFELEGGGRATFFFLHIFPFGIYRWILSFYERIVASAMFDACDFSRENLNICPFPMAAAASSCCSNMRPILAAHSSGIAPKITRAAFNEGTKDITMHKKSICRNDFRDACNPARIIRVSILFRANTLNYLGGACVRGNMPSATSPPHPQAIYHRRHSVA